MEKPGGVDLPLPTPENDVPNKVCANVTFFKLSFRKWKTKFVSKSVFRLSHARKTVGPLINLKYMLILFSKLFFKIEKRKSMTDFRFSGRRKTNGLSIHALNLFL